MARRGVLAPLGLALALWAGAGVAPHPGAMARAAGAEAPAAVTVTVTGAAIETGPADRDAARRRALFDAILAAALAGGAEVSGHSAMDKSVITSDVAIVRPVGQVLGWKMLSERRQGDTWQVTIAATVGPELLGDCTAQRRLQVTAYPPAIRVAPEAPAWSAPLMQEVANRLIRTLQDHRSVDVLRLSDRPLPDGPESDFDYVVLTEGRAGLNPGDHGFVPTITLDMGREGGRDVLMLEMRLRLVSPEGERREQILRRSVPAPKHLMLDRAAVLARPGRAELAAALTRGLDARFAELLDRTVCEGVVARLTVRGDSILAPVGRRNGLSRASLAFTQGPDRSTRLLEVVALERGTVRLRPLDPTDRIEDYAGETVRFLETGR